MDALVKFGDTKSVARELGFAIKTAEVHFSRIFKKMGLYGGGARVLAALKWYEYRRSNGATAG